MLTKDFYFDLPHELIAQYPSKIRGQDRLMLLNKQNGNLQHYRMENLVNLLDAGTLMIFNNSKVRRARVYAEKETTGRKQEFMFLNKTDKDGFIWNTMVKNAKKQKCGMLYKFADGTFAKIIDEPQNEGTEFRLLKFDFPLNENWFEKNGHIPLPPYIRRNDTEEDSGRYQNVYASNTGSAACPTAGLHFTKEMLKKLESAGIELEWITLHVGLGTFLPVREINIEDHKMHQESFTITNEAAKKINKAKEEGRTVLAVGTTSVRTLESACIKDNLVKAGTFNTSIFIYPGYEFKIADQLFTNFHTPESTLIMLVSAFAGKENILNAYKCAVENKYRFFSYGDAMLIK